MNSWIQDYPARIIQTVVVLTAVLAFVGCGPGMPEIVPISGTITIDGKPYEGVEVKFYPLQDGLDGNTVASGVTDKSGKYTVKLPGKETAGGCACLCKVTVSEGPMPDSVRESGNDQMAATAYMASLKNRPIPKAYTRMSDTPLEVEVTADQATYDFDLKR